MIICYALNPPIFIPAGSRIAQLIPLAQEWKNTGGELRGSRGFGSTGSMAMLSLNMQSTPTIQLRMHLSTGK